MAIGVIPIKCKYDHGTFSVHSHLKGVVAIVQVVQRILQSKYTVVQYFYKFQCMI